eukprot:2852727-Alexandrium_andersonii.AAC.1
MVGRAAVEVDKLLAIAKSAGDSEWVERLQAGSLGELSKLDKKPTEVPVYKRNKLAAEKVARISAEQRQTAEALLAASER